MKDKVGIVLAGIGGFGNNYVNSLLDYKGEEIFEIRGVVDPRPEGCRRVNELKSRNIPFYNSIEQFYENGNRADLAVISSPIQFHCRQSCTALSHGSHVLCEKPIAATLQEAKKMADERDRAGKILAIGFQWSYSPAILALKQDILNGLMGKPLRLKTMTLWPRDYKYYKRGWAAKIKDASGNWVLDSIANNATAHYLHNMFFILGDKVNTSLRPEKLEAEVYRANKIQNFDTAVIRAYAGNVEMLYIASHAVEDNFGPVFCYEFENAKVTYDENGTREIKASFGDGTVKKYGDPTKDIMRKLFVTIDAIKKGSDFVPCSIEAATPQLLCINAIQDAVHEEIPQFPKELTVEDKNLCGGPGIYVRGMSDFLKKCYEGWKMPSEYDVSWAKNTGMIDLRHYDNFIGWK
ncbi:MAG: Gfo/Idh/MocA family oxidoreductase [Clostridiales bacterium]|nr:Gfo/Idh/MocA family oxidoreductase [Clostridiales bacterium]